MRAAAVSSPGSDAAPRETTGRGAAMGACRLNALWPGQWLGRSMADTETMHVCMEATGVYYEALALTLLTSNGATPRSRSLKRQSMTISTTILV
jgi:hypothetical protein